MQLGSRSYRGLRRSRGMVCAALLEPQRAENFAVDAWPAFGNPLTDERCRNRSQKYAVAIVAGGQHQSLDVSRSQNRQLIRSAGSQPAPGLYDFRPGEFRCDLVRGGKNFFDAAGSIPFLVTCV